MSWCTNSIGSSIVTMCLLIVWFMWSIIAASAVDAVQRRRPNLQVQIRPDFLDELAQRDVDIEHAHLIGIPSAGLECPPRLGGRSATDARIESPRRAETLVRRRRGAFGPLPGS